MLSRRQPPLITKDHPNFERLVVKCGELYRHDHPLLAETATKGLLDMDLPHESIVEHDLKALVIRYAPKNLKGKLIRKFQIKQEDEERRQRWLKRDPDMLDDSEESEIGRIMLTPQRSDYLEAKRQLEECDFRSLSSDDQDHIDFNEPLTVIHWFLQSSHRTPSPTKETIEIAKEAPRHPPKKRAARRLVFSSA